MCSSLFKTVFFLFIVTEALFGFSQNNKTEFVIIKEVKIIGNKSTKAPIIIREIPLGVGDTILVSGLNKFLKRTESNIFNTSLFNFVTVAPVYFDDKNISLYITVEERWYWWPIPIFKLEETNFNTWLEDKDFDRVSYGLFLAKENFRGRKERAMLLFQAGYTEKIGVKYIVPFVNKKKTNGLNLMFSYSRNHEVAYATNNNVKSFYRSNNNYIKKEIEGVFGYELRPKLYINHNFNIAYKSVNVSDSVIALNSNFLTPNKNQLKYLSLNYKVKRDKRNNKNYPTLGSYCDLSLNKQGLGVLDEDLNAFYLTTHLKKFWHLKNRFYLANSLKLKLSMDDDPYFLVEGLGAKNDLVRGYELYLVNGKHFGVLKNQIRYGLLENKMFNIKAIQANKFNKIPLSIYLGAYFDMGYAHVDTKMANNSLQNKMLYGGGFSADFVSYYDMVLRLEFSRNAINENGVFVHFIAPI